MKVPPEWRAKYDIVKKSSGKAFADEWLSRKLQSRRTPRPRRRSGRRTRASNQSGLLVSECVAEYAALAVNPFVSTHSACLPVVPAYPSRKVSCFLKTSVTTGTSDVGFIAFCPQKLVANDMSGDPEFPVYTSASTFAGTTITLVDATTGVTAANGNSDMTLAEFGSADDLAQYRLVAAGLRICYASTELNRGGYLVGLSRPDHRTLSGAAITDLLAFDGVDPFYPEAGKWYEVVWSPATPLNYDFETDPTAHNHCMAFMIYNADATIQYRAEAFAHFELIGSNVRGLTPSHEDVAATSTVIQGLQGAPGPKTLSQRAAEVKIAVAEAASAAKAGWNLGKMFADMLSVDADQLHLEL